MAIDVTWDVVCLLFLTNIVTFSVTDQIKNPKITSVTSHNQYSHISSPGVLTIPAKVPVVLTLSGESFSNFTTVAFTSKSGNEGDECDSNGMVGKNIKLKMFNSTSGELKTNLPPVESGNYYYFCIKSSLSFVPPQVSDTNRWLHQGSSVRVRALLEEEARVEDVFAASVHGLRAEGDKVSLSDTGITVIQENTETTIRMFGSNFSIYTSIAFTTTAAQRGSRCDELPMEEIKRIEEHGFINKYVNAFPIKLRSASGKSYYICVKESQNYGHTVNWIHQGMDPWLQVQVHSSILPLWIMIILIILLLVLSGLFSGLNLGLMALDKNELRVIENCGTETEKKYARTISPLRKRGNYLLCSLLLGNVLVNSTLTILLDSLTSGVIAVIGSTICIVLFGEIIPQAICSRHGLAIGAQTVIVTKFFMLATFPLSYPISKILDCVLGEEIGNVYDRERLMEFIRVTKDYNKLENEEVNIISGALGLKNKTVSDVMTKVEDVYMISHDAILDFETMSEVMKQGYTRIPVYESNKNNIVALLFTKDLAFIDPDDNTPLRTVCEFYNHPITYVFEDETLDTMLDEFKKGNCHMALVRRVNNESDLDPFYEMCGVVTLEDVLEELLQSEIVDETDILTDNRRKQRRKETQLKQDFSDFAKVGSGQQGKHVISSQLALATFQYLLTSVEPFKKHYISEQVLRRLMAQNIFFTIKVRSGEEATSQEAEIYRSGTPADYFVLIIEGRARVTVGKENLTFDVGPFTYFGLPALSVGLSPADPNIPSASQSSTPSIMHSPDMPNPKISFNPDYTVIATCDVLCMKISRAVYLAAYRATLMDRQHRFDPSVDDPFQNTWDNDLSITYSKPDQPNLTIKSARSSASTPSQLGRLGNQVPGLEVPGQVKNSCLDCSQDSSRRASVDVAILSHEPNLSSSAIGLKHIHVPHRVNSTGNLDTSIEIIMPDSTISNGTKELEKAAALEMCTLSVACKNNSNSAGDKGSSVNHMVDRLPTDHSTEQTLLLFHSEI